MSVHNEYGRALEALLTSIRRIESEDAQQWATDLEAARFGQHGNLSVAAKQCLIALDRINADRDLWGPPGVGPDVDPLRDPYQHLLAHCRSILGRPS